MCPSRKNNSRFAYQQIWEFSKKCDVKRKQINKYIFIIIIVIIYSEHVIYECFKTCLRDIFMHNNATFKFITADQQLQPDAADISLPSFLQPPYSNFAMRLARRRAFEPPRPPHQPTTTPPIPVKKRPGSPVFVLDWAKLLHPL